MFYCKCSCCKWECHPLQFRFLIPSVYTPENTMQHCAERELAGRCIYCSMMDFYKRSECTHSFLLKAMQSHILLVLFILWNCGSIFFSPHHSFLCNIVPVGNKTCTAPLKPVVTERNLFRCRFCIKYSICHNYVVVGNVWKRSNQSDLIKCSQSFEMCRIELRSIFKSAF